MSSETARLTRKHLETLPTYRPGRRPEQISQELGISEAVKLSANELPFGPLPGVVEAVTRAATQVHRYPDMFVGELRGELAKRHGVDVEELVTGCGSVALCEHLTVATAAPGDEVIFGWRSFEAYPILVSRIDAVPVRVPNTPDHRTDIDGILGSVTAATRLIFLCSPNNPTGSLIRREELQRLLAGVPDNVVIALDEAYRDFVTDPHAPDSLSLRVDHPNLVVLRSFSKSWGLASARLGYMIAPRPIAEAVQKVLTTYSTSGLAQAAGLAALAQEAEARHRIDIVIAQRERVISALREFVPDIPESQGNFCWLPMGDLAAEVGRRFESHGVIVRAFGTASRTAEEHGGVRISIGSPEENDVLLKVAPAVFEGLDRKP